MNDCQDGSVQRRYFHSLQSFSDSLNILYTSHLGQNLSRKLPNCEIVYLGMVSPNVFRFSAFVIQSMIVKMVQTSKIVAALPINLPVLMEISVLNRGKDVTKDKIAG